MSELAVVGLLGFVFAAGLAIGWLYGWGMSRAQHLARDLAALRQRVEELETDREEREDWR